MVCLQEDFIVEDVDDLKKGMECEDEFDDMRLRGGNNKANEESDDKLMEEEELVQEEAVEDDVAKFAKAIGEAHIDESTKHGYCLSLQQFILYIYMRHLKFQNSSLYNILSNKLKEDLSQFEDTTQTRKLRKVIQQHLLRASPKYKPIILNQLQPQTFLGFLLSISDSKNGEYQVSYGSHRSALAFLFSTCEVPQSKAFVQKLKKKQYDWPKNTSAKARGVKGAILSEGKDPCIDICCLSSYLQMALGVEDRSTKSVTWNLMCRSKNTVKVMREHMSWETDSLGIQFAHTKTKKGGKHGYKRHIYANPDIPEICPILSLATYLLAFPSVDSGSLFPGSNQYSRFGKQR